MFVTAFDTKLTIFFSDSGGGDYENYSVTSRTSEEHIASIARVKEQAKSRNHQKETANAQLAAYFPFDPEDRRDMFT
jgi:hypothetical protein